MLVPPWLGNGSAQGQKPSAWGREGLTAPLPPTASDPLSCAQVRHRWPQRFPEHRNTRRFEHLAESSELKAPRSLLPLAPVVLGQCREGEEQGYCRQSMSDQPSLCPPAATAGSGCCLLRDHCLALFTLAAAAERTKFILCFKNDSMGAKWGLYLFLNNH